MSKTALVYLKGENGKVIFGTVDGPEGIKEDGNYTTFPDRSGRIHRIPTTNIKRIEIKNEEQA